MEAENKYSENEDLKKEAPLLSGIPKKEPFTAPDSYFEKFSSVLSEKISAESNHLPWYYFLFKKIVYIPSLILVITGTIFLIRPKTETDFSFTAKIPFDSISLEQASFASLDYYVETHLLASLNTYEIIDIVGKNEIPDLGIKVKEETVTPTLEHIEEDEMEDYILDNIDDFDMNEIY